MKASDGVVGQSASTGGLERPPVIGCIGHDGDCCVNREKDLLDARRYRFLRDAAQDAAKLGALQRANRDPQTPEQFDAAVDKAMRSNDALRGAKPASSAERPIEGTVMRLTEQHKDK